MPAFEDVVSTLTPKERICSLSFSRLCLDFCKDLSYRRAAGLISTVLHRSVENSIKVHTLSDFVERVGSKIQDYLTTVSETILKDKNFEPGTSEPAISGVVAKSEPTAEQKLWKDEIAQRAKEINDQRELQE